jgi:hypothetical protein
MTGPGMLTDVVALWLAERGLNLNDLKHGALVRETRRRKRNEEIQGSAIGLRHRGVLWYGALVREKGRREEEVGIRGDRGRELWYGELVRTSRELGASVACRCHSWGDMLCSPRIPYDQPSMPKCLLVAMTHESRSPHGPSRLSPWAVMCVAGGRRVHLAGTRAGVGDWPLLHQHIGAYWHWLILASYHHQYHVVPPRRLGMLAAEVNPAPTPHASRETSVSGRERPMLSSGL